ncbi:hypothetical protein LWI28_019732 [Acer negundo]|uniref:Uncharacterized protein n=1 Tax=Acer negundo TaxID=4023 RepID=A0AAD5NSH8_ACENE|nr:hypothetical protein LWI28_019732 [Acer negundo]
MASNLTDEEVVDHRSTTIASLRSHDKRLAGRATRRPMRWQLVGIGSMVSAKKLIGMVRKRQRQAATGRVDRISLSRASLHDLHSFSNQTQDN